MKKALAIGLAAVMAVSMSAPVREIALLRKEYEEK